MSDSAAQPGHGPGSPAERVLRWRLPGFGFLALVGVVALAVGWTGTRDGWYLTGILLTALGGAGVLWVLLDRRPAAAVSAVIAVGVLVMGLGLGVPWWQVVSAYAHDGVTLRPTDQDPQIGEDRGFMLVHDHELVSVDEHGRMRPWWTGTVRESTQVIRRGSGALIYHAPRAQGTVYLLNAAGQDDTRWRFDLPAERTDTWWDGGVVAATAATVVTHWCHSEEDCQWTGFDAATGEQQWQAGGAPVPNLALGRSGAGPAAVDGFWVATRTGEGAVQLRDPDTGSVQHTIEVDEPLALAGDRAVVGAIGEQQCTLQVLQVGADQDDDGEQEPLTGEADCSVVEALTHVPTEADYLEGDLLWLPGAGRSHVIDLAHAQAATVEHRVVGGHNTTAAYGAQGTWTAGAGVLLAHEGRQIRALDPITGVEQWSAELAGSDQDVPLPAAPVVTAGAGVVAVQVPDEPLLLEEALQDSERTTMVLHAFEAATGQPLMAPLRHREPPGQVQVRAGTVLLRTTVAGEPGTTVMFGPRHQ